MPGKPTTVLTALFLPVLLTACAASPEVRLAEIDAPCQTPTGAYLEPTPSPAVPEEITYGELTTLFIQWATQLRSCNADKEAVAAEFRVPQ